MFDAREINYYETKILNVKDEGTNEISSRYVYYQDTSSFFYYVARRSVALSRMGALTIFFKRRQSVYLRLPFL